MQAKGQQQYVAFVCDTHAAAIFVQQYGTDFSQAKTAVVCRVDENNARGWWVL